MLNRNVLLNTNLLLLLVIGSCNTQLIEKHKRTKDKFCIEDYDLLMNKIKQYGEWRITSHSLAEVSNLLRQNEQDKDLMCCLSKLCEKLKESHIDKEKLFKDSVYKRLGVTDMGIIIKSRTVQCVLTTDFDLYAEISKRKNSVINFNHLRNALTKL